MSRTFLFLFLIFACINPAFSVEKKSDEAGIMKTETFTGLKFRSIGPALMSGRISDIAVHPENRHVYYVAVSSGGVWKTENNGTTWQPIFDGEGSYSIGCVTLDPNNPFVVWVGTGENNSQRSVSYGDGVYKSIDGGKTWKNVGLKNSEHIGKIVVDPRDSDVVYVAAQGPLWRAGDDRGLYKTTDGGKTWNKILDISENTGVNDIVFDPRDPEVLYASSYQRRRRVWTLINGGPESAIYKSTDAGKNWRKIEAGIPTEDKGRIGLAVAPANPDVVYAIIEAANKAGGFFRSTNRGESWEKMSSYMSASPQYYNEIIPDPNNVDRVYAMDTWMHATNDGGRTFTKVGERFKHVDNHCLWIDPNDSNYILAGCDGGIYESYDRATTWHFKNNLPITQFYRVSVDNDFPFYNIYGGTQDNFSLGGPSRTASNNGIANRDWYVTLGGDGFETVVDPEDPNIIYSQYQNGGLHRFDKRSGEQIFIRPMPGKGEPPLRWNWDSALIISPHSHTRLYYAAQKIFRSDDRGDTWQPISPDLTRNLDRNKLEVMGKIQSVDAVAKNKSTSFFGNIISLDESPLKEGLIYAGTDDGLIQVTEDGGQNWRKMDKFPGVPSMTYVSDVLTSLHTEATVYATFDAHKDGDFKPYVLKSTNLGKSWKSISGNLPPRGSVYSIVEDHENANLLFVGTEFGVFFTVDGGGNWMQLKGGIPTIAVRDLDIQRRENDLVVGSFGRSFYVLDDYSLLRNINRATLANEASLFPVKNAWMYIESSPLGLAEKSMQGDSYYMAENPPFGAVFTYYLKGELKTLEKKRQDAEKKGSTSYPNWDQLRAEAREEAPAIILTVKDDAGNTVSRITGPVAAGFHRVAWDLRYSPVDPVSFTKPTDWNPWRYVPRGYLAVPGTYTVLLSKRVNGVETALSEPQKFETVPLGTATLPAEDKEVLVAFQKKTAKLFRAVTGASEAAGEAQNSIKYIKQAILDAPKAELGLKTEVLKIENDLKDILVKLDGDRVISSHSEPRPVSISDRVGYIVSAQWVSTSAPTQTSRDNYAIASEEFNTVLQGLRTLIETDLKNLENKLEAVEAPYTPGRLPVWEPEM